MAPQAGRNRGFSQTDLLVAIVVIGLVVGLALPGFVKAKDRALEAEVKSSLHSIQVALERYAADNSGNYPVYILGGTPRSWACFGNDLCLGDLPPDGLMRYGYMATYPANPFFRQRSSLCAWTAGDPRFGCLGEARGQRGLVMGNALSDPNFATPDTAADPGTLGPEGFPYYFLGDGNPTTRDWIPGTFVYRSYGGSGGTTRRRLCDVTLPAAQCGPWLPPKPYYYFFGGYGSWRSPGLDQLHCYDRLDPAGGFGSPSGEAECGPDGFDPWVLLANEPLYLTGDVDGDGDPDEVPNVVFMEGQGTLSGGASWPNPDGFADGLLHYLNMD